MAQVLRVGAVVCAVAAVYMCLCVGPVRAGAIPRRPEQLKFKPLQYTPPAPEQFRVELASGPVAYLVPDATLPLLQITVYIRTGGYLDPTNKLGLASVTAHMLAHGGTVSRSADALDERLDFLAAVLSASAGRLYTTVSLDLLAKDMDEGLQILREVLTEPAFQEDRLALHKHQLLQEMARRNDDSADIEAREAAFLAYGEGFWMARLPTRDTIESISRQDMIEFHRRWFWPSNFVVAVSGQFERQDMLRRLERFFGAWPFVGEPAPAPPTNFCFAAPGVYLVQKQVNQARVAVLIPGSVMWGDPDHFAALLMNDILGGGGLVSRLFNRVRSDEGLAYSVRSALPLDPLFARPFQVRLQTGSRTVAHALNVVYEQLAKMRAEPVTARELQLAKDGFIGRLSDNFATPARIANTFAEDELTGRYKLDPEYWKNFQTRIRAVTATDIRRVAERVLRTNSAVILVVGERGDIIRGHPDHPVSITNFAGGRLVDLPPRDPFTLAPVYGTVGTNSAPGQP